MKRISITLSNEETAALIAYAQASLRHPREQVRYVLRKELERRGLLPADDTPDARPAHEVQHANAA